MANTKQFFTKLHTQFARIEPDLVDNLSKGRTKGVAAPSGNHTRIIIFLLDLAGTG